MIKKILYLIVPLFSFILFKNNVLAEERYIYTDGIGAWVNNVYYTNSYSNSLDLFNNYIMFDNNYYFGFNNSSSSNISIFRDKINNLYYVIFYSSNYDLNITSTDFYSYNEGTTSNVGYYVYIIGYEEEDLSHIIELYSFINNRTKVYTCGNCSNYKYLYASRLLSNSAPVSYFYNNINNFEFIYSTKDTYFDGVKLEFNLTPPTPEPEPTPQENYNKLYVPNYNENMCVEIIDKDTIRVFEDNDSIDYIDYFVNSHYLSKSGQIDSEYVKNCTSLEKSPSFIYRNDIPEILFVALLACVFTYLSMYLLFRVFRKRSR